MLVFGGTLQQTLWMFEKRTFFNSLRARSGLKGNIYFKDFKEYSLAIMTFYHAQNEKCIEISTNQNMCLNLTKSRLIKKIRLPFTLKKLLILDRIQVL